MAEIKKTLYHGELSKMGPVRVSVKSDWLASKHKKGTYYLELEIAGQLRNLNPENEGCKEFFQGRKGQVITIAAEGRGEDGRILLVGTDLNNKRAESPKKDPPARQASPHAQAPDVRKKPDLAKGLIEAKRFIGRNRTLAQIAIKGTIMLAKEYEAEYQHEVPDSLIAAIFTSLLFGANGAGLNPQVPTMLDFKTLLPPVK